MLPTFRTERLLLRPRTMAHLESCLSMDRDPQVTRFIPGPWSDPQRHRAFVIARITARWPQGLGYWAVQHIREPPRFLGWVLLLPADEMEVEVEIGWRFTRTGWGHGYATEAARPVLDHAFQTVGLRQVVADIDPENIASIRVAEKLGLQFIGETTAGGRPARSYRITTEDSSRQG